MKNPHLPMDKLDLSLDDILHKTKKDPNRIRGKAPQKSRSVPSSPVMRSARHPHSSLKVRFQPVLSRPPPPPPQTRLPLKVTVNLAPAQANNMFLNMPRAARPSAPTVTKPAKPAKPKQRVAAPTRQAPQPMEMQVDPPAPPPPKSIKLQGIAGGPTTILVANMHETVTESDAKYSLPTVLTGVGAHLKGTARLSTLSCFTRVREFQRARVKSLTATGKMQKQQRH
jgi:hypothetical protein